MNTPTTPQGEAMCPIEDAWTKYTQATVDLFEVLEQSDPSPALVDRAFGNARLARADWNALWEVDAA